MSEFPCCDQAGVIVSVTAVIQRSDQRFVKALGFQISVLPKSSCCKLELTTMGLA